MAASGPPLEDCLRLLRSERDEQKLAGLLVAANICRVGNTDAVAKVYRAVGPGFLRRLLNTGMGLGKVEGGKEEREAYLWLAVTVLAGLARVPEVAADEGVVSTVPLVAEVVAKSTDPAITEECFELLSLIDAQRKQGRRAPCGRAAMPQGRRDPEENGRRFSVGQVYVGLLFYVYQAQFTKQLEIQEKLTCQKV